MGSTAVEMYSEALEKLKGAKSLFGAKKAGKTALALKLSQAVSRDRDIRCETPQLLGGKGVA